MDSHCCGRPCVLFSPPLCPWVEDGLHSPPRTGHCVALDLDLASRLPLALSFFVTLCGFRLGFPLDLTLWFRFPLKLFLNFNPACRFFGFPLYIVLGSRCFFFHLWLCWTPFPFSRTRLYPCHRFPGSLLHWTGSHTSLEPALNFEGVLYCVLASLNPPPPQLSGLIERVLLL